MAAKDIATAQAEIERPLRRTPRSAGPGGSVPDSVRSRPGFEAEEALRALVQHHPEDASGHHNLGTLLLRLKRYDEAARSLRQALRHRADAPATYLHLGYALKESGRVDEAAAAWQQVLRLAPNDETAREELSRVGHQMRQRNLSR